MNNTFKLAKGQRWMFKSTSLVIEIINSIIGECVVRQQGSALYKVGHVDVWGFSLKLGLDRAIAGLDCDLVYLEGQDSPE